MAKLTRKQREHLEHVLTELRRGRDYVMREDVAVVRRRPSPTTTLSYSRPDLAPEAAQALGVPECGDYLDVIDREIGSDLTGLHSALRSLVSFLETHADQLDHHRRARRTPRRRNAQPHANRAGDRGR